MDNDQEDILDSSEISPQEQTSHAAGVIAGALEATHMIEVREVQSNLINQVHLLCRIKDADIREVADKLFRKLLLCEREDNTLELFIGKQLLLDKSDNMKYAWVISIACPDLTRMTRVICDAINSAFRGKKVEVLEAPLLGPSTPQSTGRGVRGATPLRG